MRFILSAVALSTLAFAVPTLACGGDKATTAQNDKKPAIKKVTVAELADLMQQNAKSKGATVQTVDVNSDKTRASMGVIPGSVMLTSSAKYDTKVLGQDKAKTQVFYCSNTKCSASKTAAKRALKDGYTDVRVLPVGIKGWKDAGQSTATPRS